MSRGLKLTLNDYPMTYNCSDAVRMYQELHDLIQQRIQKTRQDEIEFKKLLFCSQERFRSVVQETKRKYTSQTRHGVSELFLDYPPQSAPNYSQERSSLEPARRSSLSKLVQLQSAKPVYPIRVERSLNHFRGKCKSHRRICRYIQKVSTQYQVTCMSAPDVCDAHWNSRDYSVASGFFLVPLQKDQSKVELEDKEEDQQATDLDVEPDTHTQLYQKKGITTIDISESGNLETSAESGEETEEPEWHCWVDDATVSTINEQSLFVEDVVQAEVEKSEHTEGTAEDAEAEMLPITSSVVRRQSTAVESGISKIKQSADTAKKKKIQELEPLIEVVVPEPEPEYEAESELEPHIEPEAEIEPRLPDFICPSSVSKSQKAEIKMWLRKSHFSSAGKFFPFLS